MVKQPANFQLTLFLVLIWAVIPWTAVAQDVDGRNEQKKEKLFHAVHSQNVKAVQNMLEDGVPVSVRDDRGNTPLISASFMGQKQLVHLLIKEGANVNAQNDRGRTPLMAAAVGSNPFT